MARGAKKTSKSAAEERAASSNAPVPHEVTEWFLTRVPSSARGGDRRGPLRVWGRLLCAPSGVSTRALADVSGGVHKRKRVWRTSSIVRRVSSTLLETRYGTRIALRGALESASAERVGMTAAARELFAHGFPYNWRVEGSKAFIGSARPGRACKPETPPPRAAQPNVTTRIVQRSKDAPVQPGRKPPRPPRSRAAPPRSRKRARSPQPALSSNASRSSLVAVPIATYSKLSVATPVAKKRARGVTAKRDIRAQIVTQKLRHAKTNSDTNSDNFLCENGIKLVQKSKQSTAVVHNNKVAFESPKKNTQRPAKGVVRRIPRIASVREHASVDEPVEATNESASEILAAPPPGEAFRSRYSEASKSRSVENNKPNDDDVETEEESCQTGVIPKMALEALSKVIEENSPHVATSVKVSRKTKVDNVKQSSLEMKTARPQSASNDEAPKVHHRNVRLAATKRNLRSNVAEKIPAHSNSNRKVPAVKTSLKNSQSKVAGKTGSNSNQKTSTETTLQKSRMQKPQSGAVCQAPAKPSGQATAKSGATGTRKSVPKKPLLLNNAAIVAEPPVEKSYFAEETGIEFSLIQRKKRNKRVGLQPRFDVDSLLTSKENIAAGRRSSFHSELSVPRARRFSDDLNEIEELPSRRASSGRRAARMARARRTNERPGGPREVSFDVEGSGDADNYGRGWSDKQVHAYMRMRETVAADRRDYWDVVASGVPGKSAVDCRARMNEEWVTPVKVARQTGTKSTLGTPEVAATLAQHGASKAHVKTAKFRTNMRRIHAAAARDADDDELEPVFTTAGDASLANTPVALNVADGTPGTEARERRRQMEGERIGTPEILASGRNINMHQMDLYVSMFNKRVAKASSVSKDEGAGSTSKDNGVDWQDVDFSGKSQPRDGDKNGDVDMLEEEQEAADENGDVWF